MRLSGTRLGTGLWVVERNLSRLRADRLLRRIEAGRTPAAVLPWFPLFSGAEEPGIISRWASIAQGQTDANLRRAMPLAALFAEAVGRADAYREALKGWDAMESQVIKEWTELARQQGMEKGIEKGIEKGRDEGRRETAINNLLLVLRSHPFLGLPVDLEQAVRALTDMAKFDTAFVAALSSSSLNEFRQKTGL
jgi:hypothetical protein